MNNFLFNQKALFENLSLLLLRLFIGGTFLGYGISKIQKFESFYLPWFTDKLGIPFPELSLSLVIFFQIVGGIAIILGLFTRVFAIPLFLIMLVAMLTVNIHNGFNTAPNFGYEINLAYMSILFILFSYNSGKFSLENILFKRD